MHTCHAYSAMGTMFGEWSQSSLARKVHGCGVRDDCRKAENIEVSVGFEDSARLRTLRLSQ